MVIFAALACFSCGSVDMASRYPNMVADLDPFPLETIDVAFDQLFSSKPKINKVNVVFYPRENAVALEFRHELVRYRQFWNQTGRQQFTEALAKYKADFDNKNLVTKYSKSRSAYGRLKGRAEWETFKITSTYKSAPILELGYRFRGDNPYFTVLQRAAKEETGINSEAHLESNQFAMYYTKAQADKLAELFDQNFLLQAAGVNTDDKNVDSVEPKEPEADEYFAQ